jgi:membrane protein YdbS with pleckstrin-like domain
MLRDRLLKIACISCPKNQTPLRATMPLSARKPLKKTVSRIGILSVQLLIICAVLGMLLPFDRLRTLLILIALPGLYILCSALTYPYEKRYQEKYFYDADDESLIIHKGVFGWREIVVPFRNIQSVYVDQDIYDVYFNLWDVWITTATFTSGPMAHIDGLEISDAEKLARLIIDRVEKSRSGD